MRTLRVELRKILTHSMARWVVVGVLCATGLLATMNAFSYRKQIHDGAVVDLMQATLNSGLLCVAGGVALGILVVGQEYRMLPQDSGGGCQLMATSLAMPSLTAVAAAKMAIAGLSSGIITTCGLTATEVVNRVVLGDAMPKMSLACVLPLLRAVLYSIMVAMLCAAATALLRNGLFPMIYGVATSSVVSIGWLLAQHWSWAWLLPDAAGAALVMPTEGASSAPSRAIAAAVLTVWVLVAGALVIIVDHRRDRC